MNHKKRSRAVADDGNGGGGYRKKEREAKLKDVDIDPLAATEDEVDEFFAIIRRMREAVKYFEKGKLPEPSRESDDGVKKRPDGGLFDLNTVPDEGK